VRKENVVGLFSVTLDVVDKNGRPLNKIDSYTKDARIVVTVKNISPVNRGAGIQVSIPNPAPSIDFLNGNLAQSSYISPRGIRTFYWEIIRNGGPKNLAEPIRLDIVYDFAPGLPGNPLRSPNVPFEITISAS
jgi:hypothetical protein